MDDGGRVGTNVTTRSGIILSAAGAALILAACLAGYWNSLRVPFMYDDKEVIVQSRVITEPGNWKHLFARDYFERYHERTYRPVVSYSFILSWKISHFDVFYWHLMNVLLHWLAACLVFSLSAWILKNFWGGLAAGVLFAAHPAHSEAVILVSNREELLCGLFFFAALRLHQGSLTAWRAAGVKETNLISQTFFASKSGIKAIIFDVLCVASFAAAMFSKEMAATFPAVVVAHDLLLLRDRPVGERIRGVLFAAVGTAAVVAFFLFLRYGPLRNVEGEAAWAGGSLASASLTGAKVFFLYLKMLVWPVRQCADYVVSFARNFGDPLALYGAAAFAAMIAAAFAFRRRLPAAAFSLCFFPLAFMPVSGIVPFGAVIAERYVYLPSFGIFLAAGWAVTSFSGFKWTRLALVLSATILLLILTIERNAAWRDDMTLWSDTTVCAPLSTRAHANLGNALYAGGDVGGALNEYLIAARLASPESPADAAKLPYNIGLAFLQIGRPADAVEQLERAVAAAPGFSDARLNLARAYIETGRSDDALLTARHAVKDFPDNFRVTFAAGNIAAGCGEAGWKDAAVFLRRTIRQAPDFAPAHGALGAAYLRLGENDKALEAFQRSARLDPTNPIPHVYMELLHRKAGRLAEAEKSRAEAERLGANVMETPREKR